VGGRWREVGRGNPLVEKGETEIERVNGTAVKKTTPNVDRALKRGAVATGFRILYLLGRIWAPDSGAGVELCDHLNGTATGSCSCSLQTARSQP
jgi:hypothetical protein